MTTSSITNVFDRIAPHKLIRGFLGEEMVDQLLQYAVAQEEAFVPSRVGSTGLRRVAETVRISRVLNDLGPWRQVLEERFLAVMDDAVKELGLGTIDLAMLEIDLVAHGDGAFYARHIDAATSQINVRSNRVLTGVYYFHQRPQAFSGGELRLYSIRPVEQGGQNVDIIPERDMLLLFPSWAPHEVRPVSCPSGGFAQSRFAINCWYRQRRQPVAVWPSNAAVPASLSVNPFVRLARGQDIDSVYLEIDSYTPTAGFTRKLLRDGDAGFDIATLLLKNPADADSILAGRPPAALQALWQIGLLVAADLPIDIVPPGILSLSRDFYAEHGYTLMPDCLTPAARQAAITHYQQAITSGRMLRGDKLSERYTTCNDPVGRVLQKAVQASVERLVGHPIKCSDTRASLFCEGAELPVHTEPVPCQYTVSVLLDHTPQPEDGCSPWALLLHVDPDAPPVTCPQSVGGALLFRSHEIPHSRPPLQPDHDCWVLLLHYGDADLVGSDTSGTKS